ncbi:cytochrome P450 [Flagellimonas sp.]|uniref:cytochrome P450 n=1 Tax=Flagellimonas sp. TaxID=2058762 RepID=UPI003BB0D1AB
MKKVPSISTFKVFANRRTIQKNPLNFHHRNFKKLGDTFSVSIPAEGGVIFTRDPELVKQVLQKKHRSFEKSKLQTRDLAKYIGQGLLTSNGEHWRTHRRMIQPAFHQKKLKGLIGIMRSAIQEELDRIEPGSDVNVIPLMGDLAFQVVAKTLFSHNDIRQPMAELKQITEANQNMLVTEMRRPYFRWWYRLTGEIGKHIGFSDRARDILNGLVENRLAQNVDRDDLLDMLLKATYEDGTHMPRKQLLDELMILFTAGYETTASALSFTLYFLAKNQLAQEKILDEITNLGKTQLEWQDFAKLPLTSSSIKEAMRLYPPAYFMDRVATENTDLNGIEIKKGGMILLSIFELHRHPSFWESPYEYQVDRFVGLDSKEYGNYFYPFGAGPRMCIGNAMATYEMILTVGEIVKNFKLSTKMEKVEINPLITLKPLDIQVNFERRNS